MVTRKVISSVFTQADPSSGIQTHPIGTLALKWPHGVHTFAIFAYSWEHLTFIDIYEEKKAWS